MLARMRSLLRAAGGAAVIVVVGFLLARSASHVGSGGGSLSKRASAAGFQVSYPPGWRLTFATPSAQLRLTGALSMVPSSLAGAQLMIGVAPASDPSLSSEPLVLSQPRVRTPQVVRIGKLAFYRYQGLRTGNGSGSASLYALPTTAGTIAALCTTPAGERSSFHSSCEQVLSTLRLRRGRAVAPTLDVRYALELNSILAQLNSVRRTDGPGLTDPSAAVRGRAALALWAAHSDAAAAAGRLAPTGAAAANQALVAALSAAAGAYGRLGRAAVARNPVAYARAQAAIRSATRSLDRAFARLAGLGYRLG